MADDRELGRIEAILENHTTLLGEIKTSLDKSFETNARQDRDIDKIGEKVRGTQRELYEHKNNHRIWVGWILAGTATIATLISVVGEKISKKF